MRKRAALNEARFSISGTELLGGSSHTALQAGSPLFGHQAFTSLGVDEAVHLGQGPGFILIAGTADICTVALDLATHHGTIRAVTFIALLARDEPFLATLCMGHDKTSVVNFTGVGI